MCKERNESEDPEQELILPREAWLRRERANKAFREMNPLPGLPRDTPSCLHNCSVWLTRTFGPIIWFDPHNNAGLRRPSGSL